MDIDTGCEVYESSASAVSALALGIATMKKELELGSVSSVLEEPL